MIMHTKKLLYGCLKLVLYYYTEALLIKYVLGNRCLFKNWTFDSDAYTNILLRKQFRFFLL